MNNFLTAAALGSSTNWTLTSLIQFLTKLVGVTIPIAIALCILIFFWGLVQTFGDMENAEKRSEGRNKMVWGLLALFVTLTMAGIVQVVSNTILQGS